MKKTSQRIFYIDNLRIFLTFLVVAHHWAISNGAPGDTYYAESNLGLVGTLLMSLFVATNQAFFMGFFFFISGYFVPSSLKKKGSLTFIKDRLVRLGIPLVFYIFFISPMLVFSAKSLDGTFNGSFWDFVIYEGGRSLGPMWFIALLLIFVILYMVLNKLFSRDLARLYVPIKRHIQILGFVVLVLLTFLIRINFPVGDWLPIIGIQPAHLIQYIICFSLGIWAKESNSLLLLSYVKSKKWFAFAHLLIFIGFPIVFLLGGAAEDTTPFMGGSTWQSLTFVLWEQLVALALIFGLLGIFRKFFNAQNNWLKDLSQNSYAIYVFHGLVLIAFSALFQFYQGNSFMKFILLLVPVFLICYLFAKLVRSIPTVKRIL